MYTHTKKKHCTFSHNKKTIIVSPALIFAIKQKWPVFLDAAFREQTAFLFRYFGNVYSTNQNWNK